MTQKTKNSDLSFSELLNLTSVSAAKGDKKNKVKDERQPGSIPDDIRRRMSDPLADIFSEKGMDLYGKAVSAIQKELKQIFDEGISDLSSVIHKKLGEFGYEESVDHFRPWMSSIIDDVKEKGMGEVTGALEDMLSQMSTDYAEGEEETEGDALLSVDTPEVGDEEVEVVEEEKVEEPEEPEAAPEGGEELDLGSLLGGEETPAAEASSSGERRYKPTPVVKEVFASSRRRHRLLEAASNCLDELDRD